MTYLEACFVLLNKYGVVADSYFTEDSYENFLSGKIGSPVRPVDISRTSDGLVIHHILESKVPLLSTTKFLFENQIPFDFQRKEGLVYVNEIEHFILHILIGIETEGRLGFQGAKVFIGPELGSWFCDNKLPTIPWKQNCYQAVANSEYNVVDILNEGSNIIGKYAQ